MEQLVYRLSLLLSGLGNLAIALYLLRHLGKYVKHSTYYRTRVLTIVWMVAFAVGYFVHAVFNLRYTWPSAASALTATYFHLGAICFNWGYTSLLNPSYFRRKLVIHDSLIYALSLVCYWSIALNWSYAPNYTILSFCLFFCYAVWTLIVFYSTYNRVSYRMLKMSVGNVSIFVRWMQVCCDLIVLFGIGSVAITGMFPNDEWPYVVLLFAGVGVFGYIAYSLEKYGSVIDDATKATTKTSKRGMKFPLYIIIIGALMTTLTSCSQKVQETDNLLNVSEHSSDQRFASAVVTLVLVTFGFSLLIYFRHQAAMCLEAAYHDLEIANERAEESSRIKSEFIQQISHEIRTPLNILTGFTQLITDDSLELDDETRKDINSQIKENTNRITGLVKKMLELSDAKSQTVLELNDQVHVVAIATAAVDLSKIKLSDNLTFDMHVQNNVQDVILKTNMQAATRALSMLLDNARKFSASSDDARVTLNVNCDSKGVEFIVEDNGIGVPAEESERIFEEFVQLDHNCDGTGIGLTIARSLARRLGGDIVLDTSYSDGARFVMTLWHTIC